MSWNNFSGTAQDIAMAQEIVLAYSERRQAIGQSSVAALSVGDDAQSKTLWLAMQNWLEANCTNFIDHINGPFTDANQTDFLYFTLSAWQTAAGLNVSAVDGESFRRRVEPADADSYGHITTRDCRQGTWVFEDLQKGLGMLRDTLETGASADVVRLGALRSSDQRGSCALASASQISNWALATPGTGSFVYWKRSQLSEITGPTDWYCQADAYSGKSNLTSIATCCAHTAYCYLKPTGSGGSPDYTYEDMEGLFDGEGKFTLIESLGSATVATRTTAAIGDYTIDPIGLSTVSVCPDGGYAKCFVAFDGSANKWLLSWSFSNS